MTKRAIIVLAPGFEEIEAVTAIDVLRRAEIDVAVVGLSSKRVEGAHGMVIEADSLLAEIKPLPDVLILPGGMPGAKHLGESSALSEVLKAMHQEKRLIGAICAAPALVLAKAGILDGLTATCYPSFENNFNSSTKFVMDRVVVDGHVVTSRGPGTALEFTLKLVEILLGAGISQRLAEAMLVKVV